MTIERPYGQPSCGKVIVYGDKVQQFAVHSDPTLDSTPVPKLGNWQMRLAPEAAADYDDSGWMQSAEPQQMGAYAQITRSSRLGPQSSGREDGRTGEVPFQRQRR